MSDSNERKSAAQSSRRSSGPQKPVMLTDGDGVVWSVRAEKRRQAILSIDRSDHRVEARIYLVFTSELGQRRRSRESVGDAWQGFSIPQLRELFRQGVGIPPLPQ